MISRQADFTRRPGNHGKRCSGLFRVVPRRSEPEQLWREVGVGLRPPIAHRSIRRGWRCGVRVKSRIARRRTSPPARSAYAGEGEASDAAVEVALQTPHPVPRERRGSAAHLWTVAPPLPSWFSLASRRRFRPGHPHRFQLAAGQAIADDDGGGAKRADRRDHGIGQVYAPDRVCRLLAHAAGA